MDDQRTRSSTPRSFLEFVGPAAVVGHRLAAKQRSVVGGKTWIVDQDDGGFSLHVEAGVVIPAILGRGDPMPHEHQGRIRQ
jgi:hypothetical protein